MEYGGGDLIGEACLLAGIEVFESPSSCIDMAAKTVEDQEPYNHVLDLRLTRFDLDIYHRQMNANDADGSSSTRLGKLSVYILHRILTE